MILNDKEDCVEPIIKVLESTSAWRKTTALRFPDDNRNAKAAKTLDRLSIEAASLTDTQWSGRPALLASGHQRHVPECLDERAFQLAVHVAQDLVGGLPGHRRPVRPRLDQGGEDVRDGQQPHQIGNF
jgi:hypothetical protein